MANIAVQRIKRELKEVLNSDEVIPQSRCTYIHEFNFIMTSCRLPAVPFTSNWSERAFLNSKVKSLDLPTQPTKGPDFN